MPVSGGRMSRSYKTAARGLAVLSLTLLGVSIAHADTWATLDATLAVLKSEGVPISTDGGNPVELSSWPGMSGKIRAVVVDNLEATCRMYQRLVWTRLQILAEPLVVG